MKLVGPIKPGQLGDLRGASRPRLGAAAQLLVIVSAPQAGDRPFPPPALPLLSARPPAGA